MKKIQFIACLLVILCAMSCKNAAAEAAAALADSLRAVAVKDSLIAIAVKDSMTMATKDTMMQDTMK